MSSVLWAANELPQTGHCIIVDPSSTLHKHCMTWERGWVSSEHSNLRSNWTRLPSPHSYFKIGCAGLPRLSPSSQLNFQNRRQTHLDFCLVHAFTKSVLSLLLTQGTKFKLHYTGHGHNFLWSVTAFGSETSRSKKIALLSGLGKFWIRRENSL